VAGRREPARRGRRSQPEGTSYIAGLLRDLAGITAITAPSVPSLARLRPGYFASSYGFWGVENREAALRYVPSSSLLGTSHANVELKPSDASANPYLALAAVIAAGLAGVQEDLTPPPAVQQDPGRWTDGERQRAGTVPLPSTPEQREQALLGSERVTAALGDHLLGAFSPFGAPTPSGRPTGRLRRSSPDISGGTDTHAPRSRPT
jgi:glutamine synthetase